MSNTLVIINFVLYNIICLYILTAPPSKKQSVSTVIKSDSSVKRAGNYILGPKQGNSPVKCIQQYLARKDGTDQFYVLKVSNHENKAYMLLVITYVFFCAINSLTLNVGFLIYFRFLLGRMWEKRKRRMTFKEKRYFTLSILYFR